MFIDRIILTNFRCFGPVPSVIDLRRGLSAFVGTNGTGKTAVLRALQRLFGVLADQRRVRPHDFHVPWDEAAAPGQRSLVIEAFAAFPELEDQAPGGNAVPEFFHHMAADELGALRCRFRLEATWTDDGSVDGSIEQKLYAIRALGEFGEADRVEVRGVDRGRIQMIYVPAIRDAASQVTAFLRGRLWRAVNWSDAARNAFRDVGLTLNQTVGEEVAVRVVTQAVTQRWREVHDGGTDSTPRFRAIDGRFHEFIRNVDVVFHPDEAGRERAVEDLSDGQRSLFHLAMTAATLDVESQIAVGAAQAGFHADGLPLPSLTLIAVEEPENNLAPFYLSRVVRQLDDLTRGNRAQAIVASHSASILARVDPESVRHFRLEIVGRVASVRQISLPRNEENASKFIREAVRTYPELYFARFVVLGEGASEEVVLPRLAEACGFPIDRSFVAIVPLGGRHVNHLWRLLSDLAIPHATLLDLDYGRVGGGWGRIKMVFRELSAIGQTPETLFDGRLIAGQPIIDLNIFDEMGVNDYAALSDWVGYLRRFSVYFCSPLDLDYSMLQAFPEAYQVVDDGRQGPSRLGDPRIAVLGEDGATDLYDAGDDERMRWYRYLFLGRGKPSTHVRVLSSISSHDLAARPPEELRTLLEEIKTRVERAALAGQ
jgi:putative ATP-dependent endonuclease of the OLD family